MGPKCADTCHAGRPQAAILWIHRGMSPPPEITILHLLRQIAPYSNNSLAQSPSKLIRSHAGDWTGGRHLSYSCIRLLIADHPIIQFAENQ